MKTRSHFKTSKMTGFALNVSEGGLCMFRYSWKNPETFNDFQSTSLSINTEVLELVTKGTLAAKKQVFEAQLTSQNFLLLYKIASLAIMSS